MSNWDTAAAYDADLDPIGALDTEEGRECPPAPAARMPRYESLAAMSRDLYPRRRRRRGTTHLEVMAATADSPYVLPNYDYPGNQYPQAVPGEPWPVDVWTGMPVTPGTYGPFVEPRFYLPVHYRVGGTMASNSKDAAGVSLKWRWRQALYMVGHACGVCFVEVPDLNRAWWVFERLNGYELVNYSNHYQAGYGSGYWAVVTGSSPWAGRYFYHGDRLKPAFGGGPLGERNCARFILRMLAYSLFGQTGNTQADVDALGPEAMGNPNLSGPFVQPRYGKSESDMNRLYSWGGRGFLFRYGAKGVETDRPAA